MSRTSWVTLVVLVGLTAFPCDGVYAQQPDTTGRAAVARDSSHAVKPLAAMWRSLLVPGWGQALTGRERAGALFVMWEGVTIMMTLRAEQEKRYMIASGSGSVAAKNQQIQDWLVLLAFNHLFAGAEAFVAAHLQDFPKELKLQTVPGGLAVRVAF